MNLAATIQLLAISLIPLIFAITLHEAAHGWIASKLGDTTALMMGRVTMNPIKHIDPIGTVLIPIATLFLGGFIFGWAKPVPVNFHHLNHPRRDMVMVALGGPLSNLLMAFFWGGIAKLALLIPVSDPQSTLANLMSFMHLSGQFGILINSVLLILNLLPIPPLDGSRVISAILPPGAAQAYSRLEPYGFFILIGLLLFGILGRILWPAVLSLVVAISNLYGITPFHMLR